MTETHSFIHSFMCFPVEVNNKRLHSVTTEQQHIIRRQKPSEKVLKLILKSNKHTQKTQVSQHHGDRSALHRMRPHQSARSCRVQRVPACCRLRSASSCVALCLQVEQCGLTCACPPTPVESLPGPSARARASARVTAGWLGVHGDVDTLRGNTFKNNHDNNNLPYTLNLYILFMATGK